MPEGNSYGIFGCNLHQHDLPMENKSEIVFESKYAATDFIKTNFYNLYGKGISMNRGLYRQFHCRRRKLQQGYGFFIEMFSIFIQENIHVKL